MANWALAASIAAVNRHGIPMIYSKSLRVVDEISGTVDTIKFDYNLKMYPKHLQATQFNYPNLIGKDSVMFYLPNSNLGFAVEVSDTISYSGLTYRVNSFQEHFANGEICLYKIIGVKG